MTFQRVQVPIVNWVTLSVFVAGIGAIMAMSGCQTGRESTAPGNKPPNPLAQTAAVKSRSAPFLGPSSTPVPVLRSSALAPAPRSVVPPPAPPAQSSATTTGAQLQDDEDALHARVTRGRVVLFSSSEIVAVPARGVRPKNDPPSLMEDAIANSAIQTQLNADPGIRRAGVKCRTNAGVVTIRAGDLTVAQQAAALNAALQQSNVSEVHLVKQ